MITKLIPALLLLSFSSLQLVAQDKIKVICSASMLTDIAKNIVGETAEVQTIVPIGGDPHLYEATPRDAQMIKNGDIIFINGLTFEGWIKELIANSGTSAPNYTITEGVDVISSSTYDNTSDPHAWMNAANGIIYARNIRDAMIENYPDQAETFNENYNAYEKELQELDNYIEEAILSIPAKQRILITSHDAFNYYGKRYALDVEAIIGISTEAEARTSDVARVSKMINEREVPAIFIESTINPKLIKQLADDNGVPIGGELFADSLGEPETEAGTYIGMMKSNTDVIVSALAKGQNKKTKLDDDKGSGKLTYIIIGALLLLFLIFGIIKMNK